jgi:hypothetical protein
VIPLVWRNEANAMSNRLGGVAITPWSNFWNLPYWHRLA